jgi:hypothetical protein
MTRAKLQLANQEKIKIQSTEQIRAILRLHPRIQQILNQPGSYILKTFQGFAQEV